MPTPRDRLLAWLQSSRYPDLQAAGVRQLLDVGTEDYLDMHSAWIEGGRLYGWHVTDNPDGLLAAIEQGQQARDVPPDDWRWTRELGPGIYISAAPQMWTGRAGVKWSFLDKLQPDQLDRLTMWLLEEINRKAPGYLSSGEREVAIRDINHVRAGRLDPEALIRFAGQPYNVAFWKAGVLEPLGIAAGDRPRIMRLAAQGWFARLWQVPDRDVLHALVDAGFDGAVMTPGMTGNHEAVIWNSAAITAIERDTAVEAQVLAGRRTVGSDARDYSEFKERLQSPAAQRADPPCTPPAAMVEQWRETSSQGPLPSRLYTYIARLGADGPQSLVVAAREALLLGSTLLPALEPDSQLDRYERLVLDILTAPDPTQQLQNRRQELEAIRPRSAHSGLPGTDWRHSWFQALHLGLSLIEFNWPRGVPDLLVRATTNVVAYTATAVDREPPSTEKRFTQAARFYACWQQRTERRLPYRDPILAYMPAAGALDAWLANVPAQERFLLLAEAAALLATELLLPAVRDLSSEAERHAAVDLIATLRDIGLTGEYTGTHLGADPNTWSAPFAAARQRLGFGVQLQPTDTRRTNWRAAAAIFDFFRTAADWAALGRMTGEAAPVSAAAFAQALHKVERASDPIRGPNNSFRSRLRDRLQRMQPRFVVEDALPRQRRTARTSTGRRPGKTLHDVVTDVPGFLAALRDASTLWVQPPHTQLFLDEFVARLLFMDPTTFANTYHRLGVAPAEIVKRPRELPRRGARAEIKHSAWDRDTIVRLMEARYAYGVPALLSGDLHRVIGLHQLAPLLATSAPATVLERSGVKPIAETRTKRPLRIYDVRDIEAAVAGQG